MKTDTFIGIVLVVFAAILLFLLIPAFVKPSPYGEVQERIVGTKFLPQLVAVAIGLLAVLLIVNAERSRRGDSRPTRLSFRTDSRLFVAFLICAGYVLGMYLFGFMIATVASLTGLMRIFGERRPLTLLLVSVVTTAFLYFVFAKLLYVVFPYGIVLRFLI